MTVLELTNSTEENLSLYENHMDGYQLLDGYDFIKDPDMDIFNKIIGITDSPNFILYYISNGRLHSKNFSCSTFSKDDILNSDKQFIIYMRLPMDIYRVVELEDSNQYIPFENMRIDLRNREIGILLNEEENS